MANDFDLAVAEHSFGETREHCRYRSNDRGLTEAALLLPERREPYRDLDKLDVFELGGVLWEMLRGQAPMYWRQQMRACTTTPWSDRLCLSRAQLGYMSNNGSDSDPLLHFGKRRTPNFRPSAQHIGA